MLGRRRIVLVDFYGRLVEGASRVTAFDGSFSFEILRSVSTPGLSKVAAGASAS